MRQYVLQTNGSSSTAFPRPGWDPDTMLPEFFGRMDGERLFAFLLWRLPDGVPFDDVGHHAPRHFLQCAGSADALTLEVREPSATSEEHVLSTLGRAGASATEGVDTQVTWRTGSMTVAPHEVWRAEDAAALFLRWWRDDTALPKDVVRREQERFVL